VTHVDDRILPSIKKTLGLAETDTSFDTDVIMFVNSALGTLTQIGIGPAEGFAVEDVSATWAAFLGDDPRLNSAKTYVYLRVRLLFDPPSTSFVIDALKKQTEELEWRLNVQREGEAWVDPTIAPAIPTST
jgi:hypothetical protein